MNYAFNTQEDGTYIIILPSLFSSTFCSLLFFSIQASDEIPVHLKRGVPDRLLYRTTMALTVGGALYCLVALYIAAQPKNKWTVPSLFSLTHVISIVITFAICNFIVFIMYISNMLLSITITTNRHALLNKSSTTQCHFTFVSCIRSVFTNGMLLVGTVRTVVLNLCNSKVPPQVNIWCPLHIMKWQHKHMHIFKPLHL